MSSSFSAAWSLSPQRCQQHDRPHPFLAITCCFHRLKRCPRYLGSKFSREKTENRLPEREREFGTWSRFLAVVGNTLLVTYGQLLPREWNLSYEKKGFARDKRCPSYQEMASRDKRSSTASTFLIINSSSSRRLRPLLAAISYLWTSKIWKRRDFADESTGWKWSRWKLSADIES